MAAARDELNCFICQEVYAKPVSLPCGHNFCQDCISESLNTQDESRFYTCPQCGKRFTARPSLQKNTELCEQVVKLQSAREKSQVLCTYCVNPPAPAVNTCPQCEVSLCATHLAAHEPLKHNLVNATNSLENKKCSVHNRPLKYYCPQDSACICSHCCLLGKHKGHQVNSLKNASKVKKEKLKNDLQNLLSKTEEAKTTIQNLQKSLSIEREKSSDAENQVIAIFRDLKEQLNELEKKVLSEVSTQKDEVLRYYSNLIMKLEEKEKEQSQTMCDIKKMFRITDPLSLLQQTDPDKATTCKLEKEERKEVPLIKDFDADLILGNTYRSLSAILTFNSLTDVKYIKKEEGASEESLYDKPKQEVDTALGTKDPECDDVSVCPVIDGRTYRLEMRSAGLFRCTKTGIKFQVKHPLTIEYEFDSWENHMTPLHREGYLVISRLFNIKTTVPPGAVLAVYLPHDLSAADCEVYKSYIKCVHYRDGKIILESPTRIDPSYITLENPSFCCLGALVEKMWMYISSFFSFPGAVLIYGKKLMTKYLIHLYLVPDHESQLKEVIHTKECGNGFHWVDKPAYIRSAYTTKIYFVSGPESSRITPKELHFLFTKPTAHYPYSDIRIDNKETRISLNIRERGEKYKIWECQLEDDDLERLSKPGDGRTLPADSTIFVRKNYKKLCARMPLLPPILLDLRVRGVINGDEEDALLRPNLLPSIQNDTLLKMIVQKGAEEEFCNVLKERDPRLVEDLESAME